MLYSTYTARMREGGQATELRYEQWIIFITYLSRKRKKEKGERDGLGLVLPPFFLQCWIDFYRFTTSSSSAIFVQMKKKERNSFFSSLRDGPKLLAFLFILRFRQVLETFLSVFLFVRYVRLFYFQNHLFARIANGYFNF